MTVILGDCREVLAGMEAESVSAIVTDPPYGLSKEPNIAEVLTHWLAGDDYQHNGGGFMGRTWDSFVPGPSYWRECYRVMRPGAHLLAFGGTRTVDLLGIAIRLAGFEIRDEISYHGGLPARLDWVMGSGFPKSLSVSKALDKRRDDDAARASVAGYLREALRASGKSRGEIDDHFGTANVSQYWFSPERNAQVPPADKWPWLRAFLGLNDADLDAEVWRLNGRKGQPGEAWYEREVVGYYTGVPGMTTDKGWNDGPFSRGEAGDITAPATDLARQWDGWHTALKPAHEPIVVARKPLAEKNVAANVARYGTGAINVDGCRIGTEPAFVDRPRGPHSPLIKQLDGQGTTSTGGVGRWPANVVLSHTDLCRETGVKRVKGDTGQRPAAAKRSSTESWRFNNHDRTGYADPDGTETVPAWECADWCAVKALDAQSGERMSGKPGYHRLGVNTSAAYGAESRKPGDPMSGYGDTGGASRFFATFEADPDFVPYRYCPKASRAERNAGLAGLAGMPERKSRPLGLSNWEGQTNGSGETMGPSKPQANTHPTVKPVALMRWLVRLVTPPGGLVVDPFTGSGTTGIACVLEGFRFLGIEQDVEYAEIAERRIAHAERHGENWVKAGGKAGAKLGGIYDNGQGRHSIARCPQHGEGRPGGGSQYACGCKVVYRNPRQDNPESASLTDLPLFARSAD